MGRFDYEDAEIKPGRTRPITLHVLATGGRPPPIVHIEYFGDTNATVLAERLRNANDTEKKQKKAIGRKAERVTKATEEEGFEEIKRLLREHVIRHLEAVFSDGTQATDADIPDWIEAVGKKAPDVLRELMGEAVDKDSFRNGPALAPEAAKELAKK